MKKGFLGPILIIIGALLWGAMGIFVELLSDSGLSPVSISVLRFIIGTLAIWIFVFIYDKKLLIVRVRDLPLFLMTGVFGIAGTSLSYFTTISNAGMGIAAVLMYFSPVIVVVLSRVIFKERITKPKIAACILAVVGCALVSGILSINHIEPLYLLTGLLSALCYGSYSILSKCTLNKGYSTLTVIAYSFLFATAAIMFFADLPTLYRTILSDKTLILYGTILAVVVCALPYILYTMGLSYTQPGKAAIMSSVEPVMAAILGRIFFHEQLDALKVLGIALVLSSVVVINIKRRPGVICSKTQ